MSGAPFSPRAARLAGSGPRRPRGRDRSAPALVAAVLVAAAGCASPADPATGCVVAGSGDPAEHEWILAECLAAVDRFRHLVEGRVPAGRIILTDDVGTIRADVEDGAWTLSWLTTAALREAGRRLGTDFESMIPADVFVRHEVGHSIARAYAYPDGAPDPGDGYATPLPDWLDESLAIWAEPRAMREGRLSRVGALPGVPTVAEIAAVEHPQKASGESPFRVTRTVIHRGECADDCEAEERPRSYRITSYIDESGAVRADTTDLGEPPPPDPLRDDFYPLAYALLEYVYQRGGSDAVTRWIERAAREPDSAFTLVGLPGLPPTRADPRRRLAALADDRARRGRSPLTRDIRTTADARAIAGPPRSPPRPAGPRPGPAAACTRSAPPAA